MPKYRQIFKIFKIFKILKIFKIFKVPSGSPLTRTLSFALRPGGLGGPAREEQCLSTARYL